ncbi:MAG TPA: hypothetical protein VGF95_14100 [Solirubrobacteraceae bacterium]|jgi:hypothetical protein
MNESSENGRGLRERFANGAEDRLGKAFSELLDSPLLSGALGRAFDAREKAAQAQELAMGALNLPSAADIERLTRRLRSVSQRLEGIEDSVQRLDRATGSRLSAIEEQLKSIAGKVDATANVDATAKAVPAQPESANVETSKPRKTTARRSSAKAKG